MKMRVVTTPFPTGVVNVNTDVFPMSRSQTIRPEGEFQASSAEAGAANIAPAKSANVKIHVRMPLIKHRITRLGKAKKSDGGQAEFDLIRAKGERRPSARARLRIRSIVSGWFGATKPRGDS